MISTTVGLSGFCALHLDLNELNNNGYVEIRKNSLFITALYFLVIELSNKSGLAVPIGLAWKDSIYSIRPLPIRVWDVREFFLKEK